MQVHQFGLKLRFEGGSADEHMLDLYDGSMSLHGFAQALQITTHAYINGEVTNRATALRGASFLMKAPRHGSVLTDLVAVIDKYPAAVTVSAAAFYDFLKFSISRATGTQDIEPETPYVQRRWESDQPFFDDLAEELEGCLQRAHRGIDEGNVTTAAIERPRGEKLLVFNKQTSMWVSTREEKPDIFTLTGNVTRYNTMTGNGRVYIKELKRIVPFRQSPEFPFVKRGLLTWSLHEGNLARVDGLRFQAKKVESSQGEVKRLILADCNRP